MSDKKYTEDDPQRTLVTLDQLSQTIEVMTNVVNRLRRHLSDQIKAQLENQMESQMEAQLEAMLEAQQLNAQRDTTTEPLEPTRRAPADSQPSTSKNTKRESFVVEINQQEADPRPKTRKILH
ncbi:MAG: hypothetical protein HQ498_08100 [Pseudohongiella sp.]|nr:hypothetical protein [Pseudohongiella sp.]